MAKYKPARETLGLPPTATTEELNDALIKLAASNDYYKILGVDTEAKPETIKQAFRERSLSFHQDKNSTEDAATKINLDNAFAKVKQAHDALNPTVYDNPKDDKEDKEKQATAAETAATVSEANSASRQKLFDTVEKLNDKNKETPERISLVDITSLPKSTTPKSDPVVVSTSTALVESSSTETIPNALEGGGRYKYKHNFPNEDGTFDKDNPTKNMGECELDFTGKAPSAFVDFNDKNSMRAGIEGLKNTGASAIMIPGNITQEQKDYSVKLCKEYGLAHSFGDTAQKAIGPAVM